VIKELTVDIDGRGICPLCCRNSYRSFSESVLRDLVRSALPCLLPSSVWGLATLWTIFCCSVPLAVDHSSLFSFISVKAMISLLTTLFSIVFLPGFL